MNKDTQQNTIAVNNSAYVVAIAGGTGHTVNLYGYLKQQPSGSASFTALPLSALPADELEALEAAADTYHQAMGQGGLLQPAVHAHISQALTRAWQALLLAAPETLRPLMERVTLKKRHETLVLTHPTNALLNLPWHLAQHTQGSETHTLETQPLTLAKALTKHYNEGEVYKPLPGPLRVLLMVSSPADSEITNRLSYEEEEQAILQAFEPLFAMGQVQVTFTEDGSLETLQYHLSQQQYHILHYSGHGIYHADTNTGYLELEDPLTLKRQLTKAADFAEVVTHNANNQRVPLVILSACQTAQGHNSAAPATEGNTPAPLRGVANLLLQQGTPAVIAMAHSVADYAAAQYTTMLYTAMAQPGNPHPVPAAHQAALAYLKDLEQDMIAAAMGNDKASPFHPTRYTGKPPTVDALPHTADNSDAPGTEAATPPNPTADTSNAPGTPYPSKQYHMPQLYLSQPVAALVDLDLSATQKRPKAVANLLKTKTENYQFIGRRQEKAQVLRPFLEQGQPVMLLGQGGVGKTAMADHLITRYQARHPHTVPFVLDEKTGGLPGFSKTLEHYLSHTIGTNDYLPTLALLEGKAKAADAADAQPGEGALGIFIFLLNEVAKHCQPLLVLDNLESYQHPQKPGAPFAPQHQAMGTLIATLMARQKHTPLLLTGRYPLAHMEGMAALNLSTVGFTDFWKKCSTLHLAALRTQLAAQEQAAMAQAVYKAPAFRFKTLVNTLHETFGGHYRSLEYFDEAYAADPDMLQPALQEALTLQQAMAEVQQDIADLMAEDFAFGQLVQQCTDLDKQVMGLLVHYTLPVLPQALEMQWATEGLQPTQGELQNSLSHLQALTLLEWQGGEAYTPPLVRDLWAKQRITTLPFSHEAAAEYHYQQLQAEETDWFPHLQAAYAHALHTTQHQRIGELAQRLTRLYSDQQLYREALAYAQQAEATVGRAALPMGLLNEIGFSHEQLGAATEALPYFEAALPKSQAAKDQELEGTLLNNMATIAHAKGDYNKALELLEQALPIRKAIGNKAGEGTTLNNISQIYQAKGDYDKALEFLEQSLPIRKAIGDKAGEGTTLNNMASIAHAKGDYNKALELLERSLPIRKAIGDKAGEGTTLNNISGIYIEKGDYDNALHFLNQALNIQRDIGDKAGEGTTLSNMGSIAHAKGDYDQALDFFNQTLNIWRDIGDKKSEGTCLNNISQIYKAKGDYDNALHYLNQSLTIRRDIGDKAGEGTTLNNISQIYDAKGDYDKALHYLNQALNIQRDIGDTSGMATTLHNMASIALQNQDAETYMQYESEAWQLANQIGDAYLIYGIGKYFGEVLCENGLTEHGLPMLQAAYAMGQRMQAPDLHQVAGLIQKFGGSV